MIFNYFISTNAQKVLRFFLLHPGKSCYEREIARGTKISYGSANYVLNKLYKDGILKKRNEGGMCYYTIDMLNPYIKEVKILNNLLTIEPLIEALKPNSRKIVLYGSWAVGQDTEESDIDLFIVTSEAEKVRTVIDKFSYSKKMAGKKIQAVIYSPEDLLKQDERDKVYMEQVEQGKVLWEREINEDNI